MELRESRARPAPGRRARTRAIALAALALCAWPRAARAEDAAKASALAEQAAAEARQGRPRAAIDRYREAFAALPRQEFLCKIAAHYEALAGLGDARDVRLAVLYYEDCIRDGAPTPERADVEARLARLREQKGRTPPPAPPPQAPSAEIGSAPPPRIHSPAMARGGYALIGLGLAQIVGGVVTLIIDQGLGGDIKGLASLEIGMPLFVSGAGCLAGGIPMAVIGRKTVPVVLTPLVIPSPRAASSLGAGAAVGLAIGGRL
jgi:hypothetical protein